jgi:polyisoprenoid-binding protein YceI
MNSIPKLISLLAIGVASLPAQDRAIDPQRSTITIHAGKAGIFSVAGHEHWINAPILSGTLNDSDMPRVEFRVEASKLEVKPDPKVSAQDQAQIQKDMQEKTLESAKYPDIAFRSTRVEKLGQGQWEVDGMLTLHGVTKPVLATVTGNGETYEAHAIIKQTDFGITPFHAGGGTVKVKNEVGIDFHIVARPK